MIGAQRKPAWAPTRLIPWGLAWLPWLALAGCTAPMHGSGDQSDAAALAATPVAQATQRAPYTQPAGYASGDGLRAFFEALKSLEAKRSDHVTILQLGDSHTAGDVFSGQLRALFQERFGNAGRGMLQAGLPFVGVRQKELNITQTGVWKVSNSLTAPAAGPYDITGFVSTSGSARASMTLDLLEPGYFDRARIDFLRKPGGAPLEIRIDGERREVVSTAGPLNEPGHVLVTAPGSRQLQVVALAAGTRLVSWSTERFAQGVLLDSFGVVSATVGLIDAWDPGLVRQSIARVRPALIILAYGTNEGFENHFDATAYADQFASVLKRLHHDAPEASVLVIGPPDAARTDARCLKLTAAANCHWEVPPALYAVREIQQRAAREAGDVFWDWSSVMTRDGGVDAWVRADPALSRPDHVHQTVAGYERSASNLFATLMRRYDAYRQGDLDSARDS